MKRKVLVTFSQESWGETITTNYTTYIDENNTIQDIRDRLHSDHHVKWVDVQIIEGVEALGK